MNMEEFSTMSKVKCEIKSIIGELSESDSSNSKKVVAIASWNNMPDTINIRRYNTKDGILLNGISLTEYETKLLLYTLLQSDKIDYDADHIIKIAKSKIKNKGANIEELLDNIDIQMLEPESKPKAINIEELVDNMDAESEMYNRTLDGGIQITKK